ncbi:unnamed protein product [Wickerhamomyces anomalus]
MSYYGSNRPMGATTTMSLPGQQSNSTHHQQQQQQTNGYDYSPLANQVYPYGGGSGSASSAGGSSSNGYVYNNSPLANNAVLNSQTNSSPYNNLNLSTRNNNLNGVYPTPRVSNLSPGLNFASLYSTRARFNASKGFDLEDDLEFCPEIHEHHTVQHHRFNPYTSHTFSPQNSPSASSAHTTSPVTKKDLGQSDTPKVITPRAKKVLEIVNPATGLRVASPAPYK